MKRVLITGSNRGIGLEFTRQYLEAGWWVYATCRRPLEAEELRTLSKIYTRLTIKRLDITSQEDISKIGRQFAEEPLDMLINNGAVYLDKRNTTVENIDYDSWIRTFEVNTIGTFRVIDVLLPSIVQSANNVKLIIVITSTPDAEMKFEKPAGIYHKSSKAALNAAVSVIVEELQQKKVGVIMLYPGPVATRIGSGDGITEELSVSGMIECIRNHTPDNNGALFSYDGLMIK